MIEFDRRRAMISAAGLAVGGMATARLLPEEMLLRDRRPARSRVAILSAVEYSEALVDSLVGGFACSNSAFATSLSCLNQISWNTSLALR